MADVGDSIANYEFLEEIGRGGHVVYRAEHNLTKRKYALKIIQGEFGREFVNEVQALGELKHGGIVDIIDAGSQDGIHYVVTELCDESLEDRLQGDYKFSREKIRNIMSQVLEALDYAHSKGIVHGDLKPSNILFLRERVKISDFGLAGIVQQAGTGSLKLSREEERKIAGTFKYIAPELFEGAEPNPKSDVYALGIVLYDILKKNPDKSLEEIARKASEIPVDRRYNSAKDMLGDLKKKEVYLVYHHSPTIEKKNGVNTIILRDTMRKKSLFWIPHHYVHNRLYDIRFKLNHLSNKGRKVIAATGILVVLAGTGFFINNEIHSKIQTRPIQGYHGNLDALPQVEQKGGIDFKKGPPRLTTAEDAMNAPTLGPIDLTGKKSSSESTVSPGAVLYNIGTKIDGGKRALTNHAAYYYIGDGVYDKYDTDSYWEGDILYYRLQTGFNYKINYYFGPEKGGDSLSINLTDNGPIDIDKQTW